MKIVPISLFCCLLLLSWNMPTQAATRYYGQQLCGYDDFTCVKIKRGDSWQKLWPDPTQQEIIRRLNRINMPIYHRKWVVVPISIDNTNYMALSPFDAWRETNGKRLLYVSLKQQAFGAYNEQGQLVHWGPISGGKSFCADVNRSCKTIVGRFRIERKQGPKCISSKFPIETNGGAKMPYCMHFYRGFALHGSTLPGYHASHGCIRLFPEDAKWLNTDFTKIGTPIIITRD